MAKGKCPYCGRFGLASKVHPCPGLRAQRQVPQAARVNAKSGQLVHQEERLSIDDMFEQFKDRELAVGEKHPKHHAPPITISEPIPDATGGYLAGIPERLDVNGLEISPNDSIWHHLVYLDDGEIGLSQERLGLYKTIVEDAFVGKRPQDEPVYTMLGGGPASGKTTFRNNSGQVLPDSEVVNIAADDIKTVLPEYQAMAASDDPLVVESAASVVHDESSFLAKEIRARAIAGRYHVVLDGVGDQHVAEMERRLAPVRAQGYKVVGRYVTVPVDLAADRADKRGRETGRYVEPEVIRDSHAAVSQNLPGVMSSGLFDDITLHDTRSNTSVPVASSLGGNLKISNPMLWKEFIGKASG